MKVTNYTCDNTNYEFNICGVIITIGLDKIQSYFYFDSNLSNISIHNDMYVITHDRGLYIYILRDPTNPRHRQVLYDFSPSYYGNPHYDYMCPKSMLKVGYLDALVVDEKDVSIGEFYGVPVISHWDAYDKFVK